jgi:hypothetical protein
MPRHLPATLLKLGLLLVAVVLGIMTAMGIVTNEDASNTRDMIYTPRHLLNEVMIAMVAIFLVVEAADHIRVESDRSIRLNWNRYVRILVGVGILTVHAAVILHGGY